MLFVGKVGKGGQEQPSTARRAPSAERDHYCSPTSHHHGKLCGGAGEKEAPAFGADFFSLEKHGALSSPRKRRPARRAAGPRGARLLFTGTVRPEMEEPSRSHGGRRGGHPGKTSSSRRRR